MSGVKVSKEALDVYQDFKFSNNGKYIFLKLNETSTELVVDKVSGRDATFDEMIADLPEKEGRYVIYDVTEDGDQSVGKIVLISWAPDACPVRQKMIYAASLGDAKAYFNGINITIQANTKSDLDMEEIIARCKKGY